MREKPYSAATKEENLWYGRHPAKSQMPIMSGKQSASMTTSIRRNVCTSQCMGGDRKEQRNNARCQSLTDSFQQKQAVTF